jgi:lysine N6-hydroxylase
MPVSVLDLVGVGIGPFNLGLAALAASVPGLRTRFYDQRPGFDWHAGMLIEGTTLQVGFLADLVTAADPTSPFSFLAYLKKQGRLYSFAIREALYITRAQYNQYCRWVASALPSLGWGIEVAAVDYDEARGAYRVQTRAVTTSAVETVYARNVVLGIGTVPSFPACVHRTSPRVTHSAAYLEERERILSGRSMLVVGSGQSAAEIFYDLVTSKRDGQTVTWLTRSARLFPMEDSKFSLEMASPDYIEHFHRLPEATRRRVLAGQDALYRGINHEMLGRINDLLYDRSLDGPRRDVTIATQAELEALVDDGHGVVARFRHRELEQRFERRADHVVLATGYAYRAPRFLEPMRASLAVDAHGGLQVNRDYSVRGERPGLYLQNMAPESHGFTASDLSLGPYRNSIILNAVLGYEHFAVERRTAFQDFGVPEGSRLVSDEGASESRLRGRGLRSDEPRELT